jgi:hypothetical protein
MIRSTDLPARTSSPSWPFPAVTASKPASFSEYDTISRMVVESSTTNAVLPI